MGIVDRYRGQRVIGGVPSRQIEALSSAPLAQPRIVNLGETSINNVYAVEIDLHRFTWDSSGTPLSHRAQISFHFEDTAGNLIAGNVLNSSSAGGLGLVITDSTNDYSRGRIITSSTGGSIMHLTNSGTDTARLFYALPNGRVLSGSTVIFT